ncbi:purine and uridine phosphorylase [Gautieria morchelliformis]|nr:purine and uridine phosphorylase [Gautieria morchelliformis]
MKDTHADANFPRTAEGRVYHLGVRTGEVANRIITVGPPSRARSLATLLSVEPPPFVLESERGFLTITGLYDGIPISIVAAGMGASNVDFFVREARECITGDMVIVRLGSCGGLLESLPVGSIVVPRASVSVTRNCDFDFADQQASDQDAYRVSKPVLADAQLHDAILSTLMTSQSTRPNTQVRGDVVNASADSFYSSQGRQTSFPDHNSGLLDNLLRQVDGLASLEMETFHIFHLAASWSRNSSSCPEAPSPVEAAGSLVPPVHHLPVAPSVTAAHRKSTHTEHRHATDSQIRAASVQMIFAARLSQDFITPDHVGEMESWTGKAVLQALTKFDIEPLKLHPEEGSVWELK